MVGSLIGFIMAPFEFLLKFWMGGAIAIFFILFAIGFVIQYVLLKITKRIIVKLIPGCLTLPLLIFMLILFVGILKTVAGIFAAIALVCIPFISIYLGLACALIVHRVVRKKRAARKDNDKAD